MGYLQRQQEQADDYRAFVTDALVEAGHFRRCRHDSLITGSLETSATYPIITAKINRQQLKMPYGLKIGEVHELIKEITDENYFGYCPSCAKYEIED